MNQHLRIAFLYPAEMNIYGDRGNVIALQKRCHWRGIKATIDEVNIGDKYDFAKADIIFGGGGQDKGQELVAEDLASYQEDLSKAAGVGTPMLLICGLYQLFGRRFKTAAGTVIPGIGIFGAETVAGRDRLIGNIVVESRFGQLVGFENHSGRTILDGDQPALGKVLKGSGNDGQSGHEGAIVHNVIGTYLHGPVLPKNSKLADFLIKTALANRYQNDKLGSIDDKLENQAAQAAAKLAH